MPMDFGALPPEINSGLMYAGPGSGPMLAAAAAWDGLASELGWAASGYGSAISDLTSAPWIGPSSTSMVAAVTPYVTWLSATAVQAEHTASQAMAAAAAYETAFTITVPPPVIAANRALLMALIATNFFGQNTPAIAATETHYMEMWAQDAAAMYGYAASSATASALNPFLEPPKTTNPGGVATQAAAVGQAAATPAGNSGSTVSSMTSQLSSATAVPNLLQQLSSALGSGIPAQLQNITPAMRTSLVRTFTGQPYFSLGMVQSGASIAQQLTFGQGTTAGSGGAWYPTPQFAGWGANRAAVSASVAQADRVGMLSVPPGWGASTPTGATTPSGVSLETTGIGGGGFGANATSANAGASGLLRGIPLASTGRRAASAGYGRRYGVRPTVVPRPLCVG
jgi:PPE-repeat protein